jgi:membrane fusion protein (multidrug efflux system)
MRKRMILTVGAMALVIVALGSFKFFQVQAAIAQSMSFQPPPEAVTTTVARLEPWPQTLDAIGSVAAVQGVTVSADLPGVVASLAFESGKHVQKGDLLAQLDSSQERAQLAAAQAAVKLADVNLSRLRTLRQQGVVAQAELDKTEAEALQASARAAEIRATIERKRIRAPFAGVIGLRQANLGQYLNAGDPVGSLQSVDPIHVDFAVAQQDAGRLRLGAPVRVTADGLTGPVAEGTITAFDAVVDPSTRNVQVQATFENARGVLRPGMFVQAHVQLGAGQPLVTLPATAISYAPYGDSVYVVEEMKGPRGQTYRGVRQQIVRVGSTRGDQVAVLTGLPAGAEVVTSGVFKLRPGAAVTVNNSIQPGNDPAPEPKDS